MDGLDVFRIDRDLSTAARRIDDQLRHGVAGRVATERADDVDALLDGRTEMGRAFDEITGVEV